MIRIALILLMIAFCCSVSAKKPTNLISNGGFENGDGGWNGKQQGVGKDWEVICGGAHPEMYALDSKVKHSGKFSQRMECKYNYRAVQGGSYCYHMENGQEVKHPVPDILLSNQAIAQPTKPGTIKPGHTYKLSTWVKIDGVTEKWEWFRLCIFWLDAGGKFMSETRESIDDKGNIGTHDWKLLQVTATAPASAAFAKVYLHHHFAHGIVWYDDVELVEVDQAKAEK